MLSVKPNPSRFVTVLFTILIVASFSLRLHAQDTPKAAFVEDWSHHHMIFSNPGTQADAARAGRLEQWQKVTSDPRYHLQQVKRSLGPRPVLNDYDPGTSWGWQPHWSRGRHHHPTPTTVNGIEKDWSETLGGGVSAISTVAAPVPGTNITGGTSKVTIDGQAFTASAPVAATQTGTFSGVPVGSQTVTITDSPFCPLAAYNVRTSFTRVSARPCAPPPASQTMP
jgi:hypothetical protein